MHYIPAPTRRVALILATPLTGSTQRYKPASVVVTLVMVSLLVSTSPLIVVVTENGWVRGIVIKLELPLINCSHLTSTMLLPFLFTPQVNRASAPAHIVSSYGCVDITAAFTHLPRNNSRVYCTNNYW